MAQFWCAKVSLPSRTLLTQPAGILIAFWVGLTFAYLAATELIPARRSKGEVLVFRQGHQPDSLSPKRHDIETGSDVTRVDRPADGEKSQTDVSDVIVKQTAIFQWSDVCYDVKIKDETRRILDHVNGWVRHDDIAAARSEPLTRAIGQAGHLDSSHGATRLPFPASNVHDRVQGVSGAGKTTLLDVLATRANVGVSSMPFRRNRS
jgi:hypothetical protein